MTALLSVEAVVKDYPLPRPHPFRPRPFHRALDRVDLAVEAGSCLGLVGISGSGKSTLARMVMGIEPPDSGRILLDGQDIYRLAPKALRALRRDFQMVFQDPNGSLDPRHRIGRSVAEPLQLLGVAGRAARDRVAEALAAVGLGADHAGRFPHQLSGGQRQRVAIARALVTRPRLVVLDEPVSALDVSIRAQVLNLLADLQRDLGLTFLMISHDLSVVGQMADRVAVLHQGRIVEQGPAMAVLARPTHSHTRSLVRAVLPPDPARARERLRQARAGETDAGAVP